jgi:replicative DNA helicase
MDDMMQNHYEDFLAYTMDHVGKKPETRIGISTGFPALDRFTRGFHPRKMYVLGARTGHGKTSFCTTLTANILGISMKWGPVLYFSTELTVNEIGSQIAEAHAGGTSMAPNGRTSNRDEIERLNEACDDVAIWMKQRNLYVKYQTSFTISQILEQIYEFRHGYHDGKVAMVIIDQASRVKRDFGEQGKGTTYVNATEAMLNQLDQAAYEAGCPMLLVSQANRDAAKSNERAKAHHLKHSGAFEEYAHCVIMLDHDPLTGEDTIWIDKNRHGRVGHLPAKFHGEAHTWEVTDG